MIYTKIKGIHTYYGQSLALDKVFHIIHQENLGAFVQGQTKIDEEQLYVNRFCYETYEDEGLDFEAHDRHIDIHVVLKGEEKIKIAHRDYLDKKDYDEASDSWAYTGRCEQNIILREGEVLVLFPEEAHKVKLVSKHKCKVDKLVFKIKLNER